LEGFSDDVQSAAFNRTTGVRPSRQDRAFSDINFSWRE
jgi:hypothetical protein